MADGPLTPIINFLKDSLSKSLDKSVSQYKQRGNTFKPGNPIEAGGKGVDAYRGVTAPFNTALENTVRPLVMDPARFNPISQVGAIRQMSPEQKGSYRGMADQVVEPFTINPQPVSNPIGRFAQNVGTSMINLPARGVAAGAKLPAARSTGEAATDSLEIGGLIGLLLGLAPSGFASTAAAAPAGVKMVGKPMATKTVEMAANAVARPQHQVLLEKAINSNNLGEVARILKAMPADSYKQSMMSLFGPIVKAAGFAI